MFQEKLSFHHSHCWCAVPVKWHHLKPPNSEVDRFSMTPHYFIMWPFPLQGNHVVTIAAPADWQTQLHHELIKSFWRHGKAWPLQQPYLVSVLRVWVSLEFIYSFWM